LLWKELNKYGVRVWVVTRQSWNVENWPSRRKGMIPALLSILYARYGYKRGVSELESIAQRRKRARSGRNKGYLVDSWAERYLHVNLSSNHRYLK